MRVKQIDCAENWKLEKARLFGIGIDVVAEPAEATAVVLVGSWLARCVFSACDGGAGAASRDLVLMPILRCSGRCHVTDWSKKVS